jgi:hypothetical protein
MACVCVAYVAACCLPAPTRWWMRAVWRSWNTCSKWGMPTRPTSGYDNEEIPDSMLLQNQGAIPVLVRLVDDDHGEHYRPAEARRWTETHVMVGLYRTRLPVPRPTALLRVAADRVRGGREDRPGAATTRIGEDDARHLRPPVARPRRVDQGGHRSRARRS